MAHSITVSTSTSSPNCNHTNFENESSDTLGENSAIQDSTTPDKSAARSDRGDSVLLKQQLSKENEGKSDYFKNLSSGATVRRRYLEKISEIIDIDPFTLTNGSQYRIQHDELPKMNFADIVSYFLFTHSFYTGDQLKSYKSLQAYKYVKAKFIRNILMFKIDDSFVVVGQVRHEKIPIFYFIILIIHNCTMLV